MKSINSVVIENSEKSETNPTIMEKEIMNSTIRSNVSGAKKGIQIEPIIKDSEIQSEYLV